MTALGFVTLGDRLRERNTNVIISNVEGEEEFILRCRSSLNVRRNMAKVQEATTVAREGRFKYGWKFPASRKDLVWTILGEDFGDQWATVPNKTKGPSRVVKIPAQTWFEVKNAIDQVYNQDPQTSIVRPGTDPDTIEVYTPHRNFGFVWGLKNSVPYNHGNGYRWNRDKVCWVVNVAFEQKVRDLVSSHFPQVNP